MLFLLAVPVWWGVTRTHGYLLAYAPTNLLARRVRRSPPTRGKVVGLPALTLVLLVAARVLSEAVAAGAPPWLNLVVLILAWDAIKVGCVTVDVEARYVTQVWRRAAQSRI